MNDAPFCNRSLAPGQSRLWPMLHLWWRTWRGALAAEEAYTRTRARGLPRQAAADTAFEALNREDSPQLHPERVSPDEPEAAAAAPRSRHVPGTA